MGRPKKKKVKQGRPSLRENLIRNISTIAPSSQSISHEVVEYHLPPNSPITMTDVECSLCLGVLERPVQLSCGQLCCTVCLCAWVKHTPTLDPLWCPCCPLSHRLLERQLLPAPQVLVKLLDMLQVCCKRCQQSVARAQHLEHLESGCKRHVPEPTQDTGPVRRLSLSMSPQEDLMTIQTSGRVRLPSYAAKYKNILTFCVLAKYMD